MFVNKIIFTFCAVILSVSLFFSQSLDSLKHRKWAYSGGFEYGGIIPTNEQLNFYRHKAFTGYNVQFLKQTDGSREWEKLYNYPKFGFGFFALDLLKGKDMGSPYGFYGVYNAKLKQWNRLKWIHSINLGMSFNSNEYDYDNKFYNITLGSKTNMFISLGTGLQYEIGEHFDLGLNVKFNHLSNGSTKMPNKGLNMAAAQLSLVYYPERAKPIVSDTVSTPVEKHNTLEFSVFGSRKDTFYRGGNRFDLKMYEGYNYNVYGGDALYMHQYSNKSAYGVGVGLTYDEEYNHQGYVVDSTLYEKKRFSHDRLLISVVPAYRLMIGKMYVNVGLVVYPFKTIRKYDKNIIFQRVSLQYQITDRLSASFGIRASNFHIAEYLEWRLGYTLYKKKNRK